MDQTGNSIYRYYQKASDRYFLAREKDNSRQHVWEPLAKKIDIRGYEDFDFFLLRSGNGKNRLCEGLSGSCIIDQESRPHRYERKYKQYYFIRSLPEWLSDLGGRAAINQAIVNFIFDNDQVISPRYKTIKL